MTNFIFDVDGTLTKPRSKIDNKFAIFFYKWMQDKKVYLVSGSDYDKIVEQVGEDIAEACSRVFACSGNCHVVNGNQIHVNPFTPSEELLDYLENKLINSKYPDKYSKHFELRLGMLNFSIIGRDCPFEMREQYKLWDDEAGERKEIADYINSNFLDTEATIGGEISIDIYAKMCDKRQIVRWMPRSDCVFFGDKVVPGGNDYTLAQELYKNDLNIVHNVKNWEETYNILKQEYN